MTKTKRDHIELPTKRARVENTPQTPSERHADDVPVGVVHDVLTTDPTLHADLASACQALKHKELLTDALPPVSTIQPNNDTANALGALINMGNNWYTLNPLVKQEFVAELMKQIPRLGRFYLSAQTPVDIAHLAIVSLPEDRWLYLNTNNASLVVAVNEDRLGLNIGLLIASNVLENIAPLYTETLIEESLIAFERYENVALGVSVAQKLKAGIYLCSKTPPEFATQISKALSKKGFLFVDSAASDELFDCAVSHLKEDRCLLIQKDIKDSSLHIVLHKLNLKANLLLSRKMPELQREMIALYADPRLNIEELSRKKMRVRTEEYTLKADEKWRSKMNSTNHGSSSSVGAQPTFFTSVMSDPNLDKLNSALDASMSTTQGKII